MKVSAVLVVFVSWAVAVPAYVIPLSSGQGLSWIRRILDCPPLLYGGYDTERCRNIERRVQEAHPQMTVLEVLEDDEPGRVSIHEHEEAGTFAIKVPIQFDHKRPKCNPSEIYVSELDVCVDAAEHLVKPRNKKHQEEQKHDKKEPIVLLEVGNFEKKCPLGEIWVPEVATCLHRNPPPPLEPEEWPAKPTRQN